MDHNKALDDPGLLWEQMKQGSKPAAGLLLDVAIRIISKSEIEIEIKTYLSRFLHRILDKIEESGGTPRTLTAAIPLLHFPRRRDLIPTDRPCLALNALRSDQRLGEIGAYLGDFFEEAINLHKKKGANSRALQPALKLLYPLTKEGRPQLLDDERDMLIARVLLVSNYLKCSLKTIFLALDGVGFADCGYGDGSTRGYPRSTYEAAWWMDKDKEGFSRSELFRRLYVDGHEGIANEQHRHVDLEIEVLSRFPEALINALKVGPKDRDPAVVIGLHQDPAE